MSPAMSPALSTPEAPRARGRWQLILLLLVAIGPMILATAMYQWRFWVPDSRNYHGALIGDGSQLADIGVQGAAQERWQLLVTAPGDCAEDCRQLVYAARQIHIGLNREAARAVHGLAVSRPLAADYDQQLHREYPQLRMAEQGVARDLRDPGVGRILLGRLQVVLDRRSGVGAAAVGERDLRQQGIDRLQFRGRQHVVQDMDHRGSRGRRMIFQIGSQPQRPSRRHDTSGRTLDTTVLEQKIQTEE